MFQTRGDTASFSNPAAKTWPVEQRTKREFLINRKTATTVPQSLLVIADKVIE